jgi:5-(carboxyamino)imidazole ribonucleotide synthase
MRVGVIGAGQLARMLAQAASPLGIALASFDPAADACAGALAPLTVAAFEDLDALAAFAARCDVITFDFENVSAHALARLAEVRPVRPNPKALAVAQDRALEKALFQSLGVPLAPWWLVEDAATLAAAAEQGRFPAILKTARLGYDGKGQVQVAAGDALAGAWESLGQVRCVLEQRVAFRRELSLVAVAGIDGAFEAYPLVENVHVNGILSATLAPAGVAAAVAADALDCARRLAATLEYIGVFAIEFFELDGRLLANEMAPRVHNSGHWSIEGAECSQFENHLRAICGLPLGSTAARGVSCMLNLVGQLPDRTQALRVPGLHWHDYGKTPRAGRKIGHMTITAADSTALAARLQEAGDRLGRREQVAPVLAALG